MVTQGIPSKSGDEPILRRRENAALGIFSRPRGEEVAEGGSLSLPAPQPLRRQGAHFAAGAVSRPSRHARFRSDGRTGMTPGSAETAGGPSRTFPCSSPNALKRCTARRRDRLLDGTFGAGGYSRAFLAAGATVIAIDRDPDAIAGGPKTRRAESWSADPGERPLRRARRDRQGRRLCRARRRRARHRGLLDAAR